MKKNKIITSLILALAVCFSTAVQAETHSVRKSNSIITIGGYVPILLGNSEFSNFMYKEFEMKAPNALFGASLSAGWYFSESRRWLWEYRMSLRNAARSKNNITRNWTQVHFGLNFSYAILDNNFLQLLPFAGITFVTNTLFYSDMRSIGDLDKITDVLETSFTSFNLAQFGVGSEVGLRLLIKEPSGATRRNPHTSIFIKWEQSFYNTDWHLGNFTMRDIPKFQNSALSVGFTFGF
jgi:hypothetical protein